MAPGRRKPSRLAKKVEEYILGKIKADGAIHMTLVDPEKIGGVDCATIAEEAERGGTAAIMVGGSTLASSLELDEAVKRIKSRVKVPVILFPNNMSGVSMYADAIWFMSLLNSSNTYYIVDCQALSAPMVKKYGLESIPMGYIIIGEGGAAGFVGQARGIPYDHPEIAVGYSLAAENLGMRYVYLEAGSGAKTPVPPSMIRLVKKYTSLHLVVGGGIRDAESAKAAKNAGAEIIVTGTLVEGSNGTRERINEIVSAITT